MLNQLILAALLLALTVAIHAAVLGAVLQRLDRQTVMQARGFASTTWLLIRVAAWVVLAHLLEIFAWGAF